MRYLANTPASTYVADTFPIPPLFQETVSAYMLRLISLQQYTEYDSVCSVLGEDPHIRLWQLRRSIRRHVKSYV